MQTTTDRKQQVAIVTGEIPENIRTYSYELRVLREQGILVDLTVRGLTMFTRKADWDEYGVAISDPRKERMSTGAKIILPVRKDVDQLNSIAASLRSAFNSFSADIPGFKPYNWFTFEGFKKFKAKYIELNARWQETKARIMLKTDDYRDRLSQKAAEEAEASWHSLAGQGYKWVEFNGTIYDHDSYIDMCVRRDLAALPDAEYIEKNLTLDYVVAIGYGPADFAAEQAEAERIHNQMRIDRQHTDLENQQLAEQVRFEAWKHQQEQQMMEERRQILLQEEAEHIRQQLAEQGSPFDQLVREARARAADSASEILASIKKNGFLRGKVAEKGAGLREYFQLMAAHDDHVLLGLLQALEAKIGPIGQDREEPRNIASIENTLQQIVELSDREFKTVMAGPGRFAAIEVE